MQLAHVAQDTNDTVEAVKCLTRFVKEPTKWTHVRTEKAGPILFEEQ